MYRLIVVTFILIIYSAGFGQNKISHVKISNLPTDVKESSGIVIHSLDKIWTHNDAGYDNRLFLVDTNGTLLRTVFIENVLNHDWEDLTFDQDSNLWINDAGNNSNSRRNLALYRVNKSDLEKNDKVNADKIIHFSYPDQTDFPPTNVNMNFDIEALFAFKDSLYLLTKNRSNPTNGYTKLYSLPAESGTFVAKLIDSFYVDEDMTRSRITAADYHPIINKMAMLTRTQIIEFSNLKDGNIFKAAHKRYFFNSRTNQVEALAYLDENTFYMSDEGSPNNNVPGALYKVTKDAILGSSNIPFEAHFVVHWNPINKTWIIEGKQGVNNRIKIYQVNGKEILNRQFKNQIEINGGFYTSGIYLIELFDGTNHHSCKYFLN